MGIFMLEDTIAIPLLQQMEALILRGSVRSRELREIYGSAVRFKLSGRSLRAV